MENNTGIINKQNLTVERANELTLSMLYSFDIYMLRMLDVYLSRINPRNPNSQSVSFTKKEFCELLGLHPKTRSQVLAATVHKLQSSYIVLSYESEKRRGIRNAILFPTSDIVQDKRTGHTTITLKSNPDLDWLFFNLKEHGYTKYALNETIKMRHKASMLLFYYLGMRFSASQSSKTEFSLTLQKLKEIICATKSYDDFRNLRKVLDNAMEEINTLTNLRVTWKADKPYKEIKGVIFQIERANNCKALQDGKAIDISDSYTEESILEIPVDYDADSVLNDPSDDDALRFTDDDSTEWVDSLPDSFDFLNN